MNPPETQEILDVDNPLASPDQGDQGDEGTGDEGQAATPEGIDENENPTTTTKGVSPIAAIIGAAAAAALGGLGFFFWKRKQDE